MSTLSTTNQPTNRGQKVALVVGYLAFAGAVLFAYGAPASGYEVDIYGSTPLGYWLGITISLLVAVFVTLYASQGYVSLAGLFLGGMSMTSLAGLPILRNYLFYGTGDAMTHLGWTKDIFQGVLSAFGLFYPGIHTTSLFMRGVAGSTIPRAMLLVVLAYVVAYIVFIPMCVRSMTSHRGATLISALAGLLILPVNHLGMNYMSPHPITDSVLLTPVVLYLVINYLTSPTDVFETRLPASAISTLLAVILGSSVLYHPQQAANLIILFITISFVQFVYRVFLSDSRIAEHKTLYGPTVFLIGSFMLWSVGRGRYENSVNAVLRELLSFLTGAADAGAAVGEQGNSLSAIGSSLIEVFLKLFAVSAVFAALAGLLMLTSLVGRLRDSPDTAALVKYFTVGLVVLIPYSLLFFIGSVSQLFFRNVGLIMVFSTILGSIALYRYVSGLSEIAPAGGVRALIALVVVVMLALSAVLVFPSPYIYQPNDQVTESQMSGYQFAFDHRGDGLSIYGLREGPWRYKHALFGVENTPIQQGKRGIPGENVSSLAGRTPQDRYLAVTDAARDRETEVYRGLRYSQRNLSTLSGQPRLHRVQTNGQFDLYYVPGRGAPASATTAETNESTGTSAATPARTVTPARENGSSVFGNASGTPTTGTNAATSRATTPSTPATASPTVNAPSSPSPTSATPTDDGSIFGNRTTVGSANAAGSVGDAVNGGLGTSDRWIDNGAAPVGGSTRGG